MGAKALKKEIAPCKAGHTVSETTCQIRIEMSKGKQTFGARHCCRSEGHQRVSVERNGTSVLSGNFGESC